MSSSRGIGISFTVSPGLQSRLRHYLADHPEQTVKSFCTSAIILALDLAESLPPASALNQDVAAVPGSNSGTQP